MKCWWFHGRFDHFSTSSAAISLRVMSGGCFVADLSTTRHLGMDQYRGTRFWHTAISFHPGQFPRNTKSGAGRTFRNCWHISWCVFPWRNENPCQQKSLVKGCSTEQPQDHHVVFVVIGGEHVPIPRIWVLCMLLLLLESILLHFLYKYDISGNYDCCRYYVVSTTIMIILNKHMAVCQNLVPLLFTSK